MIFEKKSSPSQNPDQVKAWFTDIVESLEIDRLTYETDTMEQSKRQFFTDMMDNEIMKVATSTRKMVSQLVISEMIRQYFTTLNQNVKVLKKLAFELSDSKILVWAEISEDDENTEDALLLAEAKVNGEFSKAGFRLLTTIVEDCDELKVPEDYVIVPIART